jgi:hypothetical protein
MILKRRLEGAALVALGVLGVVAGVVFLGAAMFTV